MSVSLIIMLLLASFLPPACNKTNPPDDPEPPGPDGPTAQVWLTRGDQLKLLSKEAGLPIIGQHDGMWPLITVDTSIQMQTIDGYGAAMTGSSAYLINRVLNATESQSLLEKLFDPEKGIGISFVRLTMGASDFSLSDYTYNDLPAGHTDFQLQNFSLSKDTLDVIPVMQKVKTIAPDLFIMGSPWSAPAWMKTNGSLKGGKLRSDCYSVYADYFVRYVQAMQAKGISISHVTPQNEPLYFTAAYPCMEMQSGEQLVFIRDHLGPKFAQAGLSTKIINYDHNWDNTTYSIQILNDPQAKAFTAGSAFHGYGGQVSAMSAVHNAHPDRELHFTEISGGAWAPDFSDNLMWYMRNIFIGTALNWSRSALMWNLALDEYHGPRNNGCPNCRGVVTINQSTRQITFNEEYYAIGHFSKFVRPGAVRVSALWAQSLTNIEAVAFVNTDGSKALVISNYDNNFKTFTVRQGNKFFSCSIPSKSVATLVWN
ncbi:MAG: glucan endo-1,6-beta-glucosidase [Bacteroidetes bacterium]|nr:glucan endo-1,6-beta-glucosidase [Bacteroidota bacterium]